MHRNATYLSKSRHGVWYYRWVVPAEIRARFPALPKELKRSTRTADSRQARHRARAMHHALLMHIGLPTTMTPDFEFDLRYIKPFGIKLDPRTGRVIEVTAEPHEAESALAAAERLQCAAEEREANLLRREEERGQREYERQPAGVRERMAQMRERIAQVQLEAATAEPLPALVAGPSPAGPAPLAGDSSSFGPTIGETFEKWADKKIFEDAWHPLTRDTAYAPSLRIFRELVGRPMQRPASDGSLHEVFDLPLAELKREVVEQFLVDFRRYPAQQGKREVVHARVALASGAAPQSQSNYYKRLEHVLGFLYFCVEKDYVPAGVAKEVSLALEGRATARKRQENEAATDDDAADGYLPFEDEELSKLFGPQLISHSQGRPDRYWVPLIGLYTGMRVGEISQLRTADIVTDEGIDCLAIRGGAKVDDVPGCKGAVTRLKAGGSRRAIPMHPHLKELGLLGYVKQRKEAGKTWLFDLTWEDKSGFGRRPSADFRELTQAADVYVCRRKVFHSLRSNLQQALEQQGLEDSLIDRFIGHKVDSIRANHYGRKGKGQGKGNPSAKAFPTKRVFEVLSRVRYPIDPEPWR